MNNKIIKVANIDFYQNELEKALFEENKKFIVKYKTIYQLGYSENCGFYAREVFKNYNKNDLGYVKRGRFIITKASLVNDLIGRQLFVD